MGFIFAKTGTEVALISKMWWECIPPFAIIAGAMWAAGQGIGLVQRYQNGGKVSLD